MRTGTDAAQGCVAMPWGGGPVVWKVPQAEHLWRGNPQRYFKVDLLPCFVFFVCVCEKWLRLRPVRKVAVGVMAERSSASLHA